MSQTYKRLRELARSLQVLSLLEPEFDLFCKSAMAPCVLAVLKRLRLTVVRGDEIKLYQMTTDKLDA